MNFRGDASAVLDALGTVRDTMGADGYRLDVVSATADRLNLEVVALDDACEDCLAPPMVLAMMVSNDLAQAYAPDEIEVVMPTTAYQH